MAGSPRIIARPTTRSPAACRRARVRQGQAFGGAKEAPSLTAAARRRWKYAVGTEECSRRGSNKRMECKGRPKWRDAPLTMKAPYKPNGGNLRGARFRWNSLNGMDVGRELRRFEGLINGKLPLCLLQMARVDLALGHRVRTD